MQFRRNAQPDACADLAANKTSGALQGAHAGLLLFFRAHDGHKDFRMRHIVADFHASDGDKSDSRILDMLMNHIACLPLDLQGNSFIPDFHGFTYQNARLLSASSSALFHPAFLVAHSAMELLRLDGLHLERLNDVAFLDVIEPLKRKSTLISGSDFTCVILEAL